MNNNFLQGIAGYNDVDVSEPVIVNKPADLPPGAYVLRIKDAKVERYSTNKIAIKLAFDIAEGPAAGYYEALYKYNKTGKYADTAKWKGTYSIWYPSGDETEEDRKRTIASLKRAVTAINNSNPGSNIDPARGINLDDFKGKIVGGAFGLVDGEYKGRQWTKCECRWLAAVDKVRSGQVETPGHKYLNGKSDKITPQANNNVLPPVQQPVQQPTQVTEQQQIPQSVSAFPNQQEITDEDLSEFEEILSDGEVVPF